MTPLLQKWVHSCAIKQWEMQPGTKAWQIMGAEKLRYYNLTTVAGGDERWTAVSQHPFIIIGVFEFTCREMLPKARSWEEQFKDETYSIGIWGATLGEVLEIALDWFETHTNNDVVAVFNKHSKVGTAYTAVHKPIKE